MSLFEDIITAIRSSISLAILVSFTFLILLTFGLIIFFNNTIKQAQTQALENLPPITNQIPMTLQKSYNASFNVATQFEETYWVYAFTGALVLIILLIIVTAIREEGE